MFTDIVKTADASRACCTSLYPAHWCSSSKTRMTSPQMAYNDAFRILLHRHLHQYLSVDPALRGGSNPFGISERGPAPLVILAGRTSHQQKLNSIRGVDPSISLHGLTGKTEWIHCDKISAFIFSLFYIYLWDTNICQRQLSFTNSENRNRSLYLIWLCHVLCTLLQCSNCDCVYWIWLWCVGTRL